VYRCAYIYLSSLHSSYTYSSSNHTVYLYDPFSFLSLSVPSPLPPVPIPIPIPINSKWSVDDRISNSESEDITRRCGIICALPLPLPDAVTREEYNHMKSFIDSAPDSYSGDFSEDASVYKLYRREELCLAAAMARFANNETGNISTDTTTTTATSSSSSSSNSVSSSSSSSAPPPPPPPPLTPLPPPPSAVERKIVVHERALFRALITLIREIDPDIIVGYEIQRASLGYLIERGRELKPEIDLLQSLSRVPQEEAPRRNEFDQYGEEHESGIHITGRIVLNVWRRMRAELKLQANSYTHVAQELLARTVPYFSQDQLLRWYTRGEKTRHLTIEHVMMLAELNVKLLDRLDLVRRTSESARLYGIDFFSVLTRGSQYRVSNVY
jgi:DNA polymerase family B, exonuclease domain